MGAFHFHFVSRFPFLFSCLQFSCSKPFCRRSSSIRTQNRLFSQKASHRCRSFRWFTLCVRAACEWKIEKDGASVRGWSVCVTAHTYRAHVVRCDFNNFKLHIVFTHSHGYFHPISHGYFHPIFFLYHDPGEEEPKPLRRIALAAPPPPLLPPHSRTGLIQ